MIKRCAACRKDFCVMWPGIWRYRRNGRFLCSWKCLRAFDHKKKGDKGSMETTKKRPGRKPKQKPEETKVELVYDPEIAEEYRREQAQKEANTKARQAEELAEGYEATAIRKNGVGEFYYDRAHGTIDWRNEYGEEVSLIPADWTKLAEEIPKMLKILGADGWTIENEG